MNLSEDGFFSLRGAIFLLVVPIMYLLIVGHGRTRPHWAISLAILALAPLAFSDDWPGFLLMIVAIYAIGALIRLRKPALSA